MAAEFIAWHARRVAKLPCNYEAPPTALKSVWSPHCYRTTPLRIGLLAAVDVDRVPGCVLPRADDCWLALAPFDDRFRAAREYEKTTTMYNRRVFLNLLVLAAAAPGETRWSQAMRVTPSASTFWIDLLRDLRDGEPTSDEEWQDSVRALLALGTLPSPRFLLVTGRDPSRSGYVELLQCLLAHNAAFDHVTLAKFGIAPPTRPLVVEVALRFSAGCVTLATVNKLRDVVAANEADAASHAIHLRITTLRFDRRCTLAPKALVALGGWLQSASTSVTRLYLAEITTPLPFTRPLLCQLTSPLSTLHALTLGSSRLLPALAACLRGGACALRQLDLRFDHSPLFAAWLAFALFHVDSHCRVSRLVLREASISMQWADSFHRALASCSGAELLAPDATNTAVDRRRAHTVATGTVMRDGAAADAATLGTLQGKTRYERVGTHGQQVALLVPGVGVGWVAATAIKTSPRLSCSHSGAATTTNGRVVSLTCANTMAYRFSSTEQEQPALRSLLSAVGASLQQLSLPNQNATDDLLAHIIVCCPHLRELNVSGNVLGDIGPLLAMPPRLVSLSLDRHVHSPYTQRLVDQTLEYTRHGSVQRLRLDAVPPPTADRLRTGSDSAQALVAAVGASEALELVSIHAAISCSELRRVDVAPSLSQRGAIAVSHRLATLALLSAVRTGGLHRAIARLDADVLARILAFARVDDAARHVLVGKLLDEASFYYR